MEGLFQLLRHSQRVPVLWNVSWAADLDKNAKPGPAGQRLIHRVCPFYKLFYKHLEIRSAGGSGEAAP